jgi:hypothetical protein
VTIVRHVAVGIEERWILFFQLRENLVGANRARIVIRRAVAPGP